LYHEATFTECIYFLAEDVLVKNFTYYNRTKLIFGKAHKQIGAEVKQYSQNILLHYGVLKI